MKDGYKWVGFQYEFTGNLYSLGRIPRCKTVMLKHLKPGQKLLVAGAGHGTEAIAAAKMGVDVTAVDLSATMLKHLNARLDKCTDIDGSLECINDDIFNMQDTEKYDMVMANFFLNVFPEKRVDELLSMTERGYKTVKIRVKNNTLKEDIRHIEVISKGVGDKLHLGVDVNQGWLVSIVDQVPAWDLNRAIQFAAACHDCGIKWLEEPLDCRDYDGNAALKKASKVKISGAELNYGWDELKIMFEKDCFDIYQPDATFAGGIAQVKQVIDKCIETDRAFSPHTWSNGIGFYINWNLALADPRDSHPLEYPLEEPSWIPEFRDGIIDPIFPDAGGQLQPFTRPGLGFEINPKMLKKYGQRFFKLTEFGLKIKVIREKGLKAALDLKKRKGKG